MTQTLDLAIIGAGVAGLTMARFAKKAGLSALVFDKADQTGGLWATLPSWQDIQFRALDWSVNDLPINGVMQGDILNNINTMVPRYQLEDMLRLSEGITGVERTGDQWTLNTSKGVVQARHIAIATGLHNAPKFPDVDDTAYQGRAIHSSALEDPSLLTGQRVTVIGGGASAYDLIDLALAHNAAQIDWVYDGLRWMVPSTQPKHARPSHRRYALAQLLNDTDTLSARMTAFLKSKYAYFSITEIMPDYDFDYRIHSLIPGRPGLIKNFKSIVRHRGRLRALEGLTARVDLKTGGEDRFETDIVLYGTGYHYDLSFLGLPKLSDVGSSAQLRACTRSVIASADYPNLYFVGATLLDGSGTTPWGTAMIARTIAHLIKSGRPIGGPVIEDNVNHWDVLNVLAPIDRAHFWPGIWRAEYLAKALWNRWREDDQIKV